MLFSRTKNGQIFKLPQEHFPPLEPTPAAQLAPVAASPAGQPAPASGEADVIRRLLQSPTPPEPKLRKLKLPEPGKEAVQTFAGFGLTLQPEVPPAGGQPG